MNHFRPIDRDTGFLMPPSVDEWLPERHLARFVVEVVAGLDLRAMTGSYRGSGKAPYPPRLLLGILVYGYATGVFSSRKLERATYDSVAFRYVAANAHPDHDTIAVFRRRFLPQIEALFVQVLVLAREMGVRKLGTVALDGTKIHANASRHSALSYEHAGRIEAQLKAEVADLMARAEAPDQADTPDGMSIPGELARREERLARIAQARVTIEARAKDRRARAGRAGRPHGAARSQDGGHRQEARRSRAPAAGRGDGPPNEDARRQTPLRPTKADARTGVRDHQVGPRFPTVPAPRHRRRPRRVEPRDHGLEHEADVRAGSRTISQNRATRPHRTPSAASWPTKRTPKG